MLFFFFQAEDGIRDLTVTGVQTCALPISHLIALARTLDLDHTGAQIAQQARAIRPGEDASQVQDGEADQRQIIEGHGRAIGERATVPGGDDAGDPPGTTSVACDRSPSRQILLAQALSWSRIGRRRMRLPVAAKIALHSAGAIGGPPGSPTPPSGALKSPGMRWTRISRGEASVRMISYAL